jgi:hypothetical protein
MGPSLRAAAAPRNSNSDRRNNSCVAPEEVDVKPPQLLLSYPQLIPSFVIPIYCVRVVTIYNIFV